MPNIFDDMDDLHIQKVWDELTDSFGFPEKGWRQKFKTYLDKQPRDVTAPSSFLRFGMDNINPILNKLLLRSEGTDTFNRLVIYIIENSDRYKKGRAERKSYSKGRDQIKLIEAHFTTSQR